jgi:hypothetical protein
MNLGWGLPRQDTSVQLVENRRIGQATEGQVLDRSRVEYQICGVPNFRVEYQIFGVIRKFFVRIFKDTVVNVTKNRNQVFLMVLVCRGSKECCN